MNTHAHGPLLFEGKEWDFGTLMRMEEACAQIAVGELGLNVSPNQLEVITSEQMLDAYASLGMPINYRHWSFGKRYAEHQKPYQRGLSGLAYEIVINTNPCISYLMEENSATMQALVIAHAAFGHNHFFNNNYLFKQWTDAGSILDYLEFAKGYITDCEQRYGVDRVERLLDAAHALAPQGVFHHSGKRKTKNDQKKEKKRLIKRAVDEEHDYNDLWRTVPDLRLKRPETLSEELRKSLLGLPEENVLYFLAKHAPKLEPWQREILRIVSTIAQYFYPQPRTKVMNEGCATYVHYRIMTRLHETGQISDGSFQEFLISHTNAISQPGYDSPYFRGFNPYALGFGMMRDIERIVSGINPLTGAPCTEEELREHKAYFPAIAGTGDVMKVLRDAWANYRDDSFIAQFLSPRLMRNMGLFCIEDDPERKEGLLVEATSKPQDYDRLRMWFSNQHDQSRREPMIDVIHADLSGDRRLVLRNRVHNKVLLAEKGRAKVLQHLANLWGYEVALCEMDYDTDELLKTHKTEPQVS